MGTEVAIRKTLEMSQNFEDNTRRTAPIFWVVLTVWNAFFKTSYILL